MKVEGSHNFDAPRELVWKALLDPEILSRTLPGFEELKPVGGNEFAGVLNFRLGPVQGKFSGTVMLFDLDPPAGYSLRLSGKGAPGFVEASGRLRLKDNAGSTAMRYELDARIGGRIASVGQRLLESSARALTRQAVEGLERQIGGLAVVGHEQPDGLASGLREPPPAAPRGRELPSQRAVAARVARGVLADLVPPERRQLLIAGSMVALALLVVLAFWVLRS